MHEIKVIKWKIKDVAGKEIDETLVDALLSLLKNKSQEKIPKGILNFKQFGRIGKALNKAEETNIIMLEEGDFTLLESMIKDEIPSTWALNPDILNAIETFLDSVSVEAK